MTIQEAIQKYINTREYFSPDYERDNEILLEFKESNPTLTVDQTQELVQILQQENGSWEPKFFVADLLYYYSTFDGSLMGPMLQAAIDFSDPSFNRIFLRPCLRSFGDTIVVHWLSEKFKTATFRERMGISSLMYWLNIDGADNSELRETLLKTSEQTNNLVELYFYKLALGKSLEIFSNIPDDAMALSDKIKGNKEYERLLYEELGWTRE